LLDIKRIESELIKNSFIEKVYYFNEMDSTNSFAKQIQDDNILVATDYQKKGRGRMERSWISENQSNLTFTIKKHFDIAYRELQSVNFFSCLCTALAIKKLIKSSNQNGNQRVSIKWPNDILLNGLKISGMLIDNMIMKNNFAIGIGINVNQKSFADEIKNKATSLYLETGLIIDNTQFLIDIVHCFDENMYLMNNHNFDKIFKLWKENTDLIGKTVTFTTVGNVERTAQIIVFQEDGGIRLLTENKEILYYSVDLKLTNIEGMNKYHT